MARAWEIIERHKKENESKRRGYGSHSKKHAMEDLEEKMKELICEIYDCGYEDGVEESDER